MTSTIKVAIGQINFTVGDIAGNVKKIIKTIDDAVLNTADLIVFPELTITSYPPEDLLARKDFYYMVQAGLKEICDASQKIDVVIGYPKRVDDKVYNTAAWLRNGNIIAEYYKQKLPNYTVFDEKRYFKRGDSDCIVDFRGVKISLLICEDIWLPEPIASAKKAGAELVVTLNASPFRQAKAEQREENLKQRAKESQLPILYVNHMGGQDDLLFDGNSMAMNPNGQLAFEAPAFEEMLAYVEFNQGSYEFLPQPLATQDPLAVLYQALVTGVRDYVQKNHFPGVILGLSGGIDSALMLAIAVDALGPEKVKAVMMPSSYTASMSEEDAQKEAELLNVEYLRLPIMSAFNALLETLRPAFEGLAPDTTEENLQARIRGTLLMALSNKTGSLVLTTGNKSEMAMGYATLYGDMVGGYAALKDVYKMKVYELACYRNAISPVIPMRVIERPPSAELAPDQKDQDTLPPYDILDQIIEYFVEDDMSIHNIIEKGFNEEIVKRVICAIRVNEYKRRQSAPGPRVTKRAFGRDRRYPITSGFSPLGKIKS